MRDQVFVSYSHRDAKLKDELLVQLKPYLRSTSVTAWSDQQIEPGGDWLGDIQKALSQTGVAVLLVSPEYLASDFIRENELGPLLRGAEAGEVAIVWIVLRACAYEQTPLRALQAVGSPERPLPERKADRAKVWKQCCQEIKRAVDARAGRSGPAGDPEEGRAVANAASQERADSPPPARREGSSQGRSPDEMRRALDAYSIYFQEASRQIALLTSYKDLHDFLHLVPRRFIAPIEAEARYFSEEECARENLFGHAGDLRTAIESLDQLVGRGTFDGDEPGTIRAEMAAAQAALEAALDSASADGVRKALWHLKRLPRLMPKVNYRLNDAAKALNLRALVTTMEAVCLQARKLGLNSRQVDTFEEGVQSLGRFDPGLFALVDAHDRWQAVEEELRRIEGDLDRSLEELESSWPALKSQVEPLCTTRTEEWAVQLASYGEQLDLTLRDRDPVKVRSLFRRYRERAGQRFFTVDVDLKTQCHNLRDAGRQLDAIGRFLA